MPYSFPDNIPKPATSWTEDEQKKCVAAANAVLTDNGSEQDAIFACIRVAGRTENEGGKNVKFADADKGIIEGVAIPFHGPWPGDRDSDGERFTEKTDFCLKWFETRPLLYQHGFEAMGPAVVGRQIEAKAQDGGVWVRAQLDMAHEYANEIKKLVEGGALFFSSGALGHLVEKSRDGLIQRWPWVELSLTPTPANPYAVAMPAAAKSFKAAGLELRIPIVDAQGALVRVPAETTCDTQQGDQITRGEQMELAEIKTAIAEGIATAMAAQAAEAARVKADAEARAAAEAQRKAEIDAAVETALKARLGGAAPAMGRPQSSGIGVLSKYDQLDVKDLDFLGMLMGKAHKGWSEQLRNALITKHDNKGFVYAGKPDDASDIAAKAIAVMDVTDTANWVPSEMSSELWRKLRLENKVAGLFRNFDMPSDAYQLPTESTDPTVYHVTEQTAGTPTLSTGITPSQAVDTKVTMTANKFGAAVWFSGELEEDNVFPVLPLLRDQLNRKMSDAVEYIIMNSDTATGAANVSDATPAATSIIVCDNGLRKYCLVTTAAQGRSCAALTIDDFIALRGLLGKGGVNPQGMAWIVDYETYLKKILSIDEFLTLDKLGPNATLLTGQQGAILGAPLIVSENLYKTGTTGVEISTGTTGNILAVVKDRWLVGWRRHPRFGVNYYDHVDATRITVLARMAFAGFNETDGTDVALGYNVTLT